MTVSDVVRDAIADADGLAAAGRLVDAVDLLAAVAAHDGADGPLAMRLTDLRHDAAPLATGTVDPSPWPPEVEDPDPDVVGLPEIAAGELEAAVVTGAIVHHGALVVRGLLDRDQVAATVSDFERMWDHQRRFVVGNRRDPWYRPVPADLRYRQIRQSIAAAGGTWLADSPACFTRTLATLAATGIVDIVADYLGSRPTVCLQKATARRAPAEEQLTDWHQDASFFHSGVRTVNVWVALTRCGGGEPVPCLEVVPRRVPERLPAECGLSPQAIEPQLIEQVAGSAPPMRPTFESGDALLFDELFVHRSYHPEGLTGHRDYLECWFFAQGHHPPDFVPFLA